jgi:hypothetical protein
MQMLKPNMRLLTGYNFNVNSSANMTNEAKTEINCWFTVLIQHFPTFFYFGLISQPCQ